MKVYCFSGSGHSEAVARFFANKLGIPALSITADTDGKDTGTAVVVFPVYCQNLPPPVKAFLPRLRVENAVLIATYGGISPGNVLCEAGAFVSGTVIAGATVPTGHTFLGDKPIFSEASLEPIFERIDHPCPALLPRLGKHPFADFLPAWRSRMGVAILRSDACSSCNLCGRLCPMGAMKNGKIGSGCIRCLRCVTNCPAGALSFRVRPLLAAYLHGRKQTETTVYL